MDCTIGCSYPTAAIGERYCGIVAAEVASEYCGIMTAVVALTERARSASRANIFVAMLAKRYYMGFNF